MKTKTHALAALCAAMLVAPASAQVQAGLYDAQGTDNALGPYTGQVQLIDQGTHLDYVRFVRYQSPTANGKPLVTVWLGQAVRQGNDLHLTVVLRRVDWITEAAGMQRTTADMTPDIVLGTYRPDPAGGLTVTLSSTYGVGATEVLTRIGGPGTSPLFVDERTTIPIHSPWPGWIRSILFAVFADYHRLPYIAPYVHRQEFQDAVHMELRDRSGFDWMRANQGTLLLHNKTVDGISLAEAEMVHGAYALKLHEKAALYDRDAEGKHLESGMLAWGARPNPAAPGGYETIEDMSTMEWSGAYLFGQRCRYLATGDPQALTNIENMITTFCDMIEIDPRVGEFARSLRPVNRSPNVGSWHAGQGQFAHLAWHDNGNNDMIKGLWVAFFSAWDVLPANHPIRPRMVRCIKEIVDHWATSNPSAAGGSGHSRDRPKTKMVTNMLAHWITGEPGYDRVWRDELRDPMLLLELAAGGYVALNGVGDWSGTHMGALTSIVTIELGRKLGSSWTTLFEHALKMNWKWTHRYRTAHFSGVAAAYLGIPGAIDETLWQLREFPYPKPRHGVDRSLDPTFLFSPIPYQPWKMDWLTHPHRTQSLYTYPIYMRNSSNHYQSSESFNRGGPATDVEHTGGEYLFVYWMARHYGAIAPNE